MDKAALSPLQTKFTIPLERQSKIRRVCDGPSGNMGQSKCHNIRPDRFRHMKEKSTSFTKIRYYRAFFNQRLHVLIP